ncbi:MAG: phosphatase PAP2 family protein [Oscillospiraceae bacterium]|nr:phosphatase PAP2 family protein [Oscillospiraceae bacterium]
MFRQFYSRSCERYRENYPALRLLYAKPGKLGKMKILSKAAVIFTYAMYAVGPLTAVRQFIGLPLLLFRVVHFTAVPFASFLFTTIARKAINAPRPYEQGVEPLIPKSTSGLSFPSRHTTCVTAIALAWLTVSPLAGCIMAVCAVYIGASRIISGVHYPLDVICGALVSVVIFAVSSVIMYFVF